MRTIVPLRRTLFRSLPISPYRASSLPEAEWETDAPRMRDKEARVGTASVVYPPRTKDRSITHAFCDDNPRAREARSVLRTVDRPHVLFHASEDG